MSSVDLTLVIPALNESSIILGNIDELSEWLKQQQPNISYELLVIDDGSTDGMGELLDKASTSREWLKVVHHSRNMGRGRGVRSGFESSVGRYIICLDADLSYSPEHIHLLLEPLINDEADITLASAHHPEGKVVNVPFQRALLSKWGNWILGLGLSEGFYTVTCIVRGFKREVIESLELVSDGKELHLELIQKALLMGYRVKEIPAILHWRDRKRGQSTKRKLLPELAIFKMRKIVLSHLIFNYITNPGMLLFLPIFSLLTVSFVGSVMLAGSFFDKMGHDFSLMAALRQTLLDGQLTLIVVLSSLVTLMIFIVFYFLSSQSKRYFDETYTLLMRMNARIKHLEKKQGKDK
jgi:dolichol-phosphate mannosyltransferase